MSSNFDIFLSCNPEDKVFVEKIANSLKNEDLEPFVEAWNLIPGEQIQEGLENALKKSDRFAVFIGQNGLTGLNNELTRLAIDKRQKGSFTVIPVFLPGVPSIDNSDLPDLLKNTASIEFDDEDGYGFYCLTCAIESESPGSREDFQKQQLQVVVFAMTATEAKELKTGSIFEEPDITDEDSRKIEQFNGHFETIEINQDEILGCYQERRYEWLPKIAAESLHKIIKKTSNSEQLDGISPKISNVDMFSTDVLKNALSANEFRKRGGILLIDAVSLFHPRLRQRLISSNLLGSDSIAISVIFPFGAEISPINRFIIEGAQDSLAVLFQRYTEMDPLCEFGISNQHSLDRWMSNILPLTADIVRNKNPNPTNIQQFSNKVNSQTSNLGRKFLGKRG